MKSTCPPCCPCGRAHSKHVPGATVGCPYLALLKAAFLGQSAKTLRAENLEIGKKVSNALIAALYEVTSRPHFIIAKGGITSHDVAQKGLGAARAWVLGQLFPGVPVWRLESGPQSRFEGVPYVVFPGNVGGPESLMQAVKLLSST